MADDTQPLLPRALDVKTVLLGAVALVGALVGVLDPLHTFSDHRSVARLWELVGKHTDEISSLKASSERYREQRREDKDELRDLRRELESVRRELETVSREYESLHKRGR